MIAYKNTNKKMILLFTLFYFSTNALYADSNLKITGAAGIKAPDIPLADTSMPDIILDPSLAGEVKIDVSTAGVPDGTKVKLKFRDEANPAPPEGAVQQGMTTIPVTLQAGNAKVLYVESEPFIPLITKSASSGKLDTDTGTVELYHLDSDVNDYSGNNFNLTYYPGWEQIHYVDGVSSTSKGIYFWITPGTGENRRVHRLLPNGTGFSSPPSKWSAEFCIKPLKDIGGELWYPFLIQDQNIVTPVFLGKSPFTGETNKLVIWHFDSKGTGHTIEIPNPTTLNSWSYIAITHDGSTVRLYVNGEEKGSVASEGNLGPQSWGDYGVAAGGIFSGNGAQLAIDEIRISNIVRNREELLNNTSELLGSSLKARTIFASKTNNNSKNLTLVKNKKGVIRNEIIALTDSTLAAGEGEATIDDDTVALFHFNGTTKDSVSKKALVGNSETIGFDDGENGNNNAAVSFEGMDDLLLVNKNLFPSAPKEWTIDFFAKPETRDFPFPVGILTIDNGQIFAMTSYLKTPEGKTILSASSLDENGNSVVIGAETDFPIDQWTHLALVYKDKKLQFLVNGKPLGEADLPTLYKKGDGAINVGSDGGDGVFSGQIDELRISDTARSQAELEVYANRN